MTEVCKLEFCCLKFIFSQVEINDLGHMLELNLGLEKSGDFILSGKWQP